MLRTKIQAYIAQWDILPDEVDADDLTHLMAAGETRTKQFSNMIITIKRSDINALIYFVDVEYT